MMWIFGIVLISGMKTLLCKGFSLGGFLLLFWIKGRQLRFNSDEWDSFFISLPERKLQKYVICIYLVAAMFSSFISYFILELTGYRNSIGIAILIFAVGVLITACKWHTKERDYLLRRYREIPDTILERQNGGNRKKWVNWLLKGISESRLFLKRIAAKVLCGRRLDQHIWKNICLPWLQ